jgi:hypothetical protein
MFLEVRNGVAKQRSAFLIGFKREKPTSLTTLQASRRKRVRTRISEK